MHKSKVFITGGSGFLGSAILSQLAKRGDIEILALKRNTTNTLRTKSFNNQIKWINSDEGNYVEKVIDFQPSIIIHCAWAGVTAKTRGDWEVQLQNFQLFNDLITISSKVQLDKLIVLGSQAEYGTTDRQVREDNPVDISNAYAACKVAMQKLTEAFCNEKKINWYWLRVFSVYGPGEDENWFIPWIIINQLKGKNTDLTACEQQYDYLFIDDFAAMLERIALTPDALSGIYNICSGNSVSLKFVAEVIQREAGNKAKLNFGALPYRLNQAMYIGGDNSKYRTVFGEIAGFGLHKGINRTINYYRDDFTKDGGVL